MSSFSLSASLVLLSIGSAGAFAQANSNMCHSCTMVIDEGADLDHKDLLSQMHLNAKEKGGLPNVDDDANGFVDDVAGWNALSNDGLFMPPKVKETFVKPVKEYFKTTK